MDILQTKSYKEFRVGNISFDDYHLANRCLNGDTVEWDGAKCVLKKRGEHRMLVGILELNSKYLYGHTSRGVKIYLFHPLDPAYPPMRVGCSEKDTSSNQLALVKFESWTETMPRGNLIRLLGPVGSMDAEKVALQWLYGRPELAKLTVDLDPAVAFTDRPLLLSTNTINIDPEGCQDIDDLVTLLPTKDGWDLYITIADVGEFVSEQSPADVVAKERCQTLYQNGQAVLPMLPKQLSEQQLSLLPGEKRQGVALHCHWNGIDLAVNGFHEVTVINQKSYSYETVYYAAFPIDVLKEIASFLKGSETNDSHEWIEQLMLLYNLEGAKILLKANAGLLRTHNGANVEVLEQMEAIHPDLRIFAFEAAQYELTGENKVHATLGNRPYTHLTSPLRRYADLVNQRILKAYLKEQPVPQTSEDIPLQLNRQQKRQKKHDRELFFLQQILLMKAGCIDGTVVESSERKTKIYIPVWKRIIKVKSDPLPVGSEVEVDYYSDLKKVSWKERIVFRIKN